MQALARLFDRRSQTLEAHSRVHQVAQNGFALRRVACEIRIDRLGEECLAKARIALRARQNRFFKVSCQLPSAMPGTRVPANAPRACGRSLSWTQ